MATSPLPFFSMSHPTTYLKKYLVFFYAATSEPIMQISNFLHTNWCNHWHLGEYEIVKMGPIRATHANNINVSKYMGPLILYIFV